LGFPIVILFLFCTPSLDMLNSFSDTPQPFLQLYAMSLGMGGHIFMNVVCILGLILNTSVAGVASSRLIWAVARDGVLPFSGWISKVSEKQEPKNAIMVMHAFSALLLCTILPSAVAFTSLVSAAGVPTITSYALIAFGRCFITPHSFKNAPWSLGKFSRPMNFVSFLWNTYLAAVLFSPLSFPVTVDYFNFSCVIFFAITVFAILSWYFIPESKWLPAARLGKLQEIHAD